MGSLKPIGSVGGHLDKDVEKVFTVYILRNKTNETHLLLMHMLKYECLSWW